MNGDWSSAQQHIERAQEFFQAGLWAQALSELNQAIAINPYEADWHTGMGLTLDAMERYDEAVTAYENAARLRENDPELLMRLGVALLRTGAYRRSIEALERVEKLDPRREESFCHRILAHAQLGEHERAEELFYLARQLVDQCPRCLDHMGHSLAAREQFDRAVWCWQETLRLEPGHTHVYHHLAQAAWRQGQLDRARRMFMKQLRREPGDTDCLLELGVLLMQMDRQAEAGEKFRRALEQDPTLATPHLHLGELALLAGHLESARSELQVAQRLDPDLPAVALRLAEVYRRLGREDRALHLLRREQQIDGRSPGQTLDLAAALIELDQPLEAVTQINALVTSPLRRELDPPSLAAAHLFRGVAHLMLGHYPSGLRDCRRCLRLAPSNLLALQNLILGHLAQREPLRAACFLRRARQLAPGQAWVRHLTYRVRLAQWRARLTLRRG